MHNEEISIYQKPENMSLDEWNALDLDDPLMAVC